MVQKFSKKTSNFWHFDPELLTFFDIARKISRKLLNLNLYDVLKTVYDFHAWKITNCQNVDYTGCSSAVSSDLSFSRNMTRVWSLSEIGLVSDWYPELSDSYPPIRALSTLIRNSDSQSEVKTVTIIWVCGHLKIAYPMELLLKWLKRYPWSKITEASKVHVFFQIIVLYWIFQFVYHLQCPWTGHFRAYPSVNFVFK